MTDAPMTNPRSLHANADRRRSLRLVPPNDAPEAATGPFRGILIAVALSLPLWAALIAIARVIV